MTITLPSGAKVRCQSHRRFYVIHEATVAGIPGASVTRRTDSERNARDHARREGQRLGGTHHIYDSFHRRFVPIFAAPRP